MNRLEALISLNMIPQLGSRCLQGLCEFFGRPENIFKAPSEKLVLACGGQNSIAEKIRFFNVRALEKELALVKKSGVTVLVQGDADYPKSLNYISSPPIVLYVKGRLIPEDIKAIAIVGSRRASFYGLSLAEKFSAGLAAEGFTIVSGMARGIDTASHRGALKHGGRTLAVIGSGFNRIYPPENQGLVEEISSQGAAISEFPMETAPLRQNFPRRNRLISGLSLGVLVVEAANNSGALITADFALEQGREVFALPGKVDSPHSYGTHGLIKQGAKLVSCVEDITEEFGMISGAAVKRREHAEKINPQLSSKEKVLYALLDKQQPVSLDMMAEKTEMAIPQLSQLVFGLQIKRLIRQLPGEQFVKA